MIVPKSETVFFNCPPRLARVADAQRSRTMTDRGQKKAVSMVVNDDMVTAGAESFNESTAAEAAGHVGPKGPPGIPATPLFCPHATYQAMGGALNEVDFFRKLCEIHQCREILCEFSAEELRNCSSLTGLWLSIWAEVHSEECFPGSRKAKHSRRLEETQTKEEVFLRLVNLVYDLFCAKANDSCVSDTMHENQKYQVPGQVHLDDM